MKTKLFVLFLCLTLLLNGCSRITDSGLSDNGGEHSSNTENSYDPSDPSDKGNNSETKGDTADLGDDDKAFGEEIEDTGAYDGYFEDQSRDFTVECISGTKNTYTVEGNTLTFTAVTEESVYSISGTFNGNIVIDTGDSYKFDLELNGFSLVCSDTNPIIVKSGNEVALKAQKDTKNYVYDTRSAIDQTNEVLYSGAIHSEVDLEIGGKGELTVVSENNNGIHSKDDLQVKNLTLFVACIDNSLKGNDSVTLEGCNTTLIASGGDCIKTSSSDISEKGNQRGSVLISGGNHTLYAACDGIDASYNVTVDGDDTELSIYTDKYSNYSDQVTAEPSSEYYIRYTSKSYKYSVKFTSSQSNASTWVNAEYHSEARGGRSTYYYYSFQIPQGYDKLQCFVYSSNMEQQQSDDYAAATDVMTVNTAYDTVALTNNGYSWTNYTTSVQNGGFGGGPGGMGGGMGGPGGMQDGNSDKPDYSAKGIKAANEIVISGGTVSIKSYDDALHANNDTALESGASPLGNITVSGGTVTAYSNDDGLHADGILSVKAGTVSVINSYEGLEGSNISISGGYVSVNAKDDGVNATATSGTAVTVSGGYLYIYCTGDGIDSNSRSSYSGILFSGGKTVVISNSGGNSAIDSEQGYKYTGGAVVAIMPRGGMSNEATHCQSFSSVGKSTQIALSSGSFLVVGINNTTATVKMPASISSALVIVLGDSSPSVTTGSSASAVLDENGVAWS